MTDVEAFQLACWRGEFGDAYTERNSPNEQNVRSRTLLWARILQQLASSPPESVLEIGANLGSNLRAIRALSGAKLYAVEPNKRAREALVEANILPATNVMDAVAASIPLANDSVDLAFTCGVLIHIHPGDLLASCHEIFRVTRRYLVIMEYFADKEETIIYRGRKHLLFKRDFGSFWLDNFTQLQVLDYGFAWKRVTGLDNLTWWVFEKRL